MEQNYVTVTLCSMYSSRLERWATDGNFYGSHESQENAVGMGINDLFTWEWEWYFVNGREYRDCSRKFLASFVDLASCIAWKGN